MRLPGFTAEASLRGIPTSYNTGSTHVNTENGAAVIPQFFRCWGEVCCNEWGYCIHKGHVLM